jgi:hypothetical protein
VTGYRENATAVPKSEIAAEQKFLQTPSANIPLGVNRQKGRIKLRGLAENIVNTNQVTRLQELVE